MSLCVINLEEGLPFVIEALDTLAVEVVLAKERNEKCALVIHGYGKRTQGGGKIRESARREMLKLKEQGKIKDVVFGENMSRFDERLMRLRYEYPDLAKYLTGNNLGVSLILF